MPAFGRIVKECREIKELKVYELADLAKVSAVYITEIEHGRKIPLPPVVARIAVALDQSPEKFVYLALSDRYPEMRNIMLEGYDKAIANFEKANQEAKKEIHSAEKRIKEIEKGMKK